MDESRLLNSDGYGEDEYDYGESSDLLLDDNGFPSFDSDCYYFDKEERQSISDIQQQQQLVLETQQREEASFASEFYSSGTDWSCLLHEDEDKGSIGTHSSHNNNKWGNESAPICLEKKLKQADLLQMWGLKETKQQQQPDLQPQHTAPFNRDKKVMETASIAKSSKASPVPAISVTGKKRIRGPAYNCSRPCPFYKKIPGTAFTVDAFRYGGIEGCLAYFLTHFHSDHYGGLTKGWSNGPIYCTPLTARLIRLCLSINPLFIHPLELNTEHVIERVKVTLLEANHCPGAALIYFRLPNGRCYLHTGDFRACKQMQTYPLLVKERVNVLYLDTTYCNPKYKFPPKEDVLSYVIRVTKNFLEKQPKTLIVVGAYSIGKECVYLAIAKALRVKIFASASRRRVLQSFGWPDLSGSLCKDGKDTLLHVLPISSLRFESLRDYLKTYLNQYAAVLAFRPTGWTYSESMGNQLDLIRPSTRGNITIYGVPYSEHSSFTELQDFIQFLRPEKIIPTVNIGSATNRDKMQSYFREWLKG